MIKVDLSYIFFAAPAAAHPSFCTSTGRAVRSPVLIPTRSHAKTPLETVVVQFSRTPAAGEGEAGHREAGRRERETSTPSGARSREEAGLTDKAAGSWLEALAWRRRRTGSDRTGRRFCMVYPCAHAVENWSIGRGVSLQRSG